MAALSPTRSTKHRHDVQSNNSVAHVREFFGLKRLRNSEALCAEKDAQWGNVVREGGEIEVDITHVAVGQMNVTSTKSARLSQRRFVG